MGEWALFITCLVNIVWHLSALRRVLLSGREWRPWAGYLLIVTALYMALAWSYAGLLGGDRTAVTHLGFEGMVGPLLLLHPGLMIHVALRAAEHDLADHTDLQLLLRRDGSWS